VSSHRPAILLASRLEHWTPRFVKAIAGGPEDN
jgi:hypothetical protein